jgi:hypothetical protein
MVVAHAAERAGSFQLRLADRITAFRRLDAVRVHPRPRSRTGQELRLNTELTRSIHALISDLYDHVMGGPGATSR